MDKGLPIPELLILIPLCSPFQEGLSSPFSDPPPTRSDRSQGQQGQRVGLRVWWDEGVPLHGDPLRGDCRVPWEAEEPWGSGPFGQVGPGGVL